MALADRHAMCWVARAGVWNGNREQIAHDSRRAVRKHTVRSAGRAGRAASRTKGAVKRLTHIADGPILTVAKAAYLR